MKKYYKEIPSNYTSISWNLSLSTFFVLTLRFVFKIQFELLNFNIKISKQKLSKLNKIGVPFERGISGSIEIFMKNLICFPYDFFIRNIFTNLLLEEGILKFRFDFRERIYPIAEYNVLSFGYGNIIIVLLKRMFFKAV